MLCNNFIAIKHDSPENHLIEIELHDNKKKVIYLNIDDTKGLYNEKRNIFR